MLIDAHTHHYKEYPETIEVLQVVNVRNMAEYECLKDKRNVSVSYGLHPWWIDTDTLDETLLHEVEVIGEIGLDKAIETPIERQIELFEYQLHIAKKLGRPVIIHCVRAYNEVQQSLKRVGFGGKVLFHAYRSTKEMAVQLIRICDAHFSFGPRELSSSKIRELILSLPQERVHYETDDTDILITQVVA